jgi:Putative peptidoglycan binding domain.
MATARRPTVTIIRIRTIMIPAITNSGDYQGQMYYDQNGYPDQSQGYYDSGVYQTQAYDDPNGYSDESQSDYSTIAAAQERLARQGYYRGETDGVLSPEMQKAVRRYQSTNGLRQTGYLDGDTLAIMGLSKGTSY